MTFKASQLPFVGYKQIVNDIKKQFDLDAGHYPLEITVKDGYGRLLMQQTFKNVWDRKSEPEVMTDDDWTVPIDIEASCREWTRTITLDEVQVPKADNNVQLDLSEYFEV